MGGVRAISALAPDWPTALASALALAKETGLRYRVAHYPVSRSWFTDGDAPAHAWHITPIRESTKEPPC